MRALPKVARIGTDILHFVAFARQFRGWGRLLKDAVKSWYDSKDDRQLAYQVLKYQQRDGWSHRDILRLTHPNMKKRSKDRQDIYHWIVKGWPSVGEMPHPSESLQTIVGV